MKKKTKKQTNTYTHTQIRRSRIMYLWNRTPTDTDCCSEPEGTSVAELNKIYRGIYYTPDRMYTRFYISK